MHIFFCFFRVFKIQRFSGFRLFFFVFLDSWYIEMGAYMSHKFQWFWILRDFPVSYVLPKYKNLFRFWLFTNPSTVWLTFISDQLKNWLIFLARSSPFWDFLIFTGLLSWAKTWIIHISGNLGTPRGIGHIRVKSEITARQKMSHLKSILWCFWESLVKFCKAVKQWYEVFLRHF